MEILAYGEDALTFWAMKNRLPEIIQGLSDVSDPTTSQVFFRPSFGRRGGDQRSEFGEFDFILLTEEAIYLGESKWTGSAENIREGTLELRSEQIARHALFRFYIEGWMSGHYDTWGEFEPAARIRFSELGIQKPIARAGSLLASNLQTVLGIIRKRYTHMPALKNVLLYLHAGIPTSSIPQNAGIDFMVVAVDYSEGLSGNFIRLT